MPIKSTNPATGEEVGSFDEIGATEVDGKIKLADEAFSKWKNTSFMERAKLMKNAAELLRKKKQEYGEIMTLEMGKPITAARAEAEKCAWVCEFYAENAEKFLANEVIATDAVTSYVQHDPLGIILAVMPWNFPFWQLFRAAAPTLMAGNVMLLKHASNVPRCGIKIEEIFTEAGFPGGVMQNLLVGSSKVEAILRNDRVRAATLTGSEYAGSQVAKVCGEEIKRTVLELGGSDPFIVLEDADLPMSCTVAISARFQNGGQSCIAAKRFIVVESRYDEFLEKLLAILSGKIVGDPTDEKTDIGPLATQKILEDLEKQVQKSVEMGAKVLAGGKRVESKGYFYKSTVLADIKKGMPVYDEETFGPVAAVIKVKNAEEAIEVANDTKFGLGASIWTANKEAAQKMAGQINAGAVFINGMVKSDPRLPFGGIKKSGYGRELSHHGIHEFVNAKTVWVA